MKEVPEVKKRKCNVKEIAKDPTEEVAGKVTRDLIVCVVPEL